MLLFNEVVSLLSQQVTALNRSQLSLQRAPLSVGKTTAPSVGNSKICNSSDSVLMTEFEIGIPYIKFSQGLAPAWLVWLSLFCNKTDL